MPSRNVVKEFSAEQYYHIYNRGVEKRNIFQDDQDYVVFLGLLKKYLIGEMNIQKNRRPSKSFFDRMKLIAYCLMSNHFHLMFYQKDETAITELMRRISTGYAMYFNNKYNRVGGLFQGNFKAAHINSDAYLHHISRYIHLNPKDPKSWPYSSLDYYIGNKKSKWVNPEPVMELFEDNPREYIEFIDDYVDTKRELNIIKWQLANNLDAEEL